MKPDTSVTSFDPLPQAWDLDELFEAPRTEQARDIAAEGVEGIFYEGLSWKGGKTRVFAWVGIPKTKPGKPVPGIVLVHGGGGTAFADWVRLWNSRGYAAIAMDTCGCLPGGDHGKRPRHKLSGPPGWGGFDQIDWPREDQWAHHAVADVILANSLLRSLPQVDEERVGLTGISWGGYLTCLAAGVDPRFCFAAPVYGCGFTTDHTFAPQVLDLGENRALRWMNWWDPSMYLPDAAMPMLWVSGSNDFAYTLNALQKSYRTPQGSRTLCIRLRMPHGQEPGAAPAEIHAFAESVVAKGAPLPRVTDQGRDGDTVRASFVSRLPVREARLNVTSDTGSWPERVWRGFPARIAGGKITARLPKEAAVYFFNLITDDGMVVSTEHVTV